MCKQLPT